ncbi:hypothetical protein QVD17_26097 [Tagetes erecta]|uniref:Protein kinase domain-containing protein n=1 Tax=Tagetes erecta TaxID=13708 RepID=A0AAD8K685_TARER|nr:hypothetical protein QVD17_26097 [Tagetes erecta]
MAFFASHTFESSSSSYSPQPCRRFTFSEIQLATQNFDESLVIGRGGFGKVYRGTVTFGGVCLDVAIKRMESGSNQGVVEFWADIEMLLKLRHYHLVSLIGYCSDGQETILVYEYMSNGTLADRLYKCQAPLTWVRRLKICIGAAHGLHYLHTCIGTKPRVTHRNVKSSNILLTSDWIAKISDFGLSKIGPTNQSSTIGYLDPDYFQTGRLTRKSDVYAFGVVLFEILCGKQAVDRSIDEEHGGLATWAQDSYNEGRLKQIVDSNIRGRISPICLSEFALIARRCLHRNPLQRPTMFEVMVGLESLLLLQEKIDSTLLIKLFGTSLPTFLFPSNQENSVGATSIKSLDIYLSSVVGENRLVHRFDYSTIVQATENFSEANKSSYEGYKFMYKGRLQDGQDIAITQYSYASNSMYEECISEASILVEFEHENVIRFIGYCIDGTKVYLIYDFAPKATLASLIYDPMCRLLDWNKRCKIILGVARALVYLHSYAPIPIIHGDVKAAKILLDENFEPKLSGFGLAKLINETDCINVDSIRGTSGYVSAEYQMTLRLSTKEDVFGFGVLVLETVTGRRNNKFTRLANGEEFMHIKYVRTNWLEGTLSNIIDRRIDVDPILMTKFIEIGLLCVQEKAADRPTMKEVVGMLLDTSSRTLLVSEMRARVINVDHL